MELNVTLAGANFRPADAKDFIKHILTSGDKCRLQRDRENPFDERAVRILGIDPLETDIEIFIGFVPRTDNLLLAQAMDQAEASRQKFEYDCTCTGFLGTLQPTFTITFGVAEEPYDADNYGQGGSEYGSEPTD